MKKILLIFFLLTGFFHAVDAMEHPQVKEEYLARLRECQNILLCKLPDSLPANDKDCNDRILLLTKKIEALNFLESKIPSEEKKPFAADFGIERDKWQEQIWALKAEQEKRVKKQRNVD